MIPNWCVGLQVSNVNKTKVPFMLILLHARSYKSLMRKLKRLKRKYGIFYTDGLDMFIEQI